MRVSFKRIFEPTGPTTVRTLTRVAIGGEVLAPGTILDKGGAIGGTPLKELWERDLEVMRAGTTTRIVGAY